MRNKTTLLVAIATFTLTQSVNFTQDSYSAIAQNIPKAECNSNYGQIACGYNCVANYGVVRCAEWPGGVCEANYGKVVCGPPAPLNWASLYGNSNTSSHSNNPNGTVPRINWGIFSYGGSSIECQRRAYSSMQNLGMVSLEQGENNRFKYVRGNWENNTLAIFVAGSNQEYVDNIRKNLVKNIGLQLKGF
ncbi:MAG: hypothetical protein KME38_00845 [Spirirestis rafaelensis WJT71-NPBG6]|jgi:hypothetical protein|nr:hypothetical protein [Spirirestis rafaelensis WJT71-NPBG6]